MSASPSFSQGNYLQENFTIPTDPLERDEFFKRTLESFARFINRKDTGQYETVEVQNNQTFPGSSPQNKNFIYRKVISTGILPNIATNSIAHGISGINNNWNFTRIYGSAFDPAATNWISIPNENIGITVDNTNINITTTVNLTAYTSSQVILEFYKG